MTSSVPFEKILEALQIGEIELQGQFILGSNYTFLVQVRNQGGQFISVYKPERGERPLWDFPFGSLEKREAAAFVVSQALGWELVPPVVYRLDGPYGPGSVQVFIEHDPEYHYFNFEDADVARLRPAATFDLLINNADRKGGHIIKDRQNHLWLIDHGLCFHRDDKLRTVLWDFAGQKIPAALLRDIRRLQGQLEEDADLQGNLAALLQDEEIAALERRAERLLASPRYPYPDEQERQFPWPPV